VVLKKMMKISWQERVTNEDVLIRAGETRKLMEAITTRKRRWVGHVMRHESLLSDS